MARAWRWGGRGLVLVLALLGAGCGEGPSPIRLSVELSDDSFCPGGKLEGVAKPETVDVRLGLRARGRSVLELKRLPIDLKVYRNDDHTKVQQRRRIHVSMTVGETWRRPLEPVQLVPPGEEGRYIVEVSTEDGAWSTTPLEVWYDAEACPRPGRDPRPDPAPPPSAPPAAAGGPRRTALQAGLRALWRCNAEKGVEDLEVRVRVHNPATAGRAERGVRPRVVGIDELDAFEMISGSMPQGYLAQGSTLEFQAFGWIETGSRPLAIHLAAERSPVATGLLEVDCSGGAGARGTGVVGAWGP